MKNLKVIKIDSDTIYFNNGVKLFSDHQQDCCESHYLSVSDLELSDFDGLIFDLSNDTFFNRIEDYGIELLPLNGHSVKIAGYGYNNGYYSHELTLCLEGEGISKRFDITECQLVTD